MFEKIVKSTQKAILRCVIGYYSHCFDETKNVTDIDRGMTVMDWICLTLVVWFLAIIFYRILTGQPITGLEIPPFPIQIGIIWGF